MPKRTRLYRDSLLEDLQQPAEAAAYLNAALEDSDEMFLIALRDVAEARQMAKVAEAAGVARESIYRMLTSTGNPTYNTLLGILKGLGLRLSVTEVTQEPLAQSLLPTLAVQSAKQSEGIAGGESEIGEVPAGEWNWRKGMGVAAMALPFAHYNHPAAGVL